MRCDAGVILAVKELSLLIATPPYGLDVPVRRRDLRFELAIASNAGATRYRVGAPPPRYLQ
jgi:hypothetical protein